MGITDRRQREWGARTRLILETADRLLAEHGYLGLNLDALAGRIEYSKATVYNHFASKEDLVLAVVNHHMEQRVDFFSRALTFEGRTRERLFVIGIADQVLARRNPHGFPLMQLAESRSIWERAAEATRATYGQLNERCMRIGLEVIAQGRACGELPEEAAPDGQILAGLVSMAKGTHLLAGGFLAGWPRAFGGDLIEALNQNYHLYLDGVGWRPFGTEHDYESTRIRILDEIFTEEALTLHPPDQKTAAP